MTLHGCKNDRGRAFLHLLLIAWLYSVAVLSAQISPSPINLAATPSPSTAQPGVTVLTLICSNLPAGTVTSTNLTIALQVAPNAVGPNLSAAVTAFAALPAGGGRITFQITGPNVAIPTAYLVAVSGTTSTGAAFANSKPASLTVNPPAQILAISPPSAQPGQAVQVTLTGQYTSYTQGSTVANFGPGISVGGAAVGQSGPVTVTSATTAVAKLTISVATIGGPRLVTVSTGVQTASANLFSVTAPVNRPPQVSAGPNQSVTRSWELLVSSNNNFPNNPRPEGVLRFDGSNGAFLGVVAPILLADGLAYPYQLFVDSANRLYVSVRGGLNAQLGGIYRYDSASGTFIDAFIPLGAGGTGDAPSFTFGPDGNLYITKESPPTVKRYNGTTGAFIDLFATDPFPDALFSGITFGPDGHLYAGNGNATLIFDGITGAFLGRFADGVRAGLFYANSPVFGPDGNLYVSGLDSGNVARFDGKTGAFIDTFVKPHSGGLERAGKTQFGPDGNFYVTDVPGVSNFGQVLRYDGKTGQFIDAFIPVGSGGLLRADGLFFHANPVSLSGTISDDGNPSGATLTATWTKVSGPGIVTLSRSSFSFPDTAGTTYPSTTTATFSSPGVYVLRLTASDSLLSNTSDVTVTVLENPTLLSSTPNSGQQGQAGLAIAITGRNTHFAQSTTSVSLGGGGVAVNSVTVTDATHLTANISIALNAAAVAHNVTVTTGTEQVTLLGGFTVHATNQPPVLTIAPTWSVTLPSRLILTYTVTDDGLPLGGALTTSWETVSGPGNVGFQSQTVNSISVGFDQAGTYVLKVTVTDTQFTVTQNVNVTVNASAAPPTVSIASPSEGTEVTTFFNVTGSVASTALASWTLEFRMENESIFRPLATGTTQVTNGVLGTFDPTLLLNGIALIRLRATDTSNQTAVAGPVSVVLTKNQKIGNFTVSFNDLTVPVAGLPIQVIRTYDSRNKTIGDFGVGWTMDLKTVRLSENIITGDTWNATKSGGAFPTYCIQPAKPHFVTVTLSDGTTYTFDTILTPQCQQLVPPDQVAIGFTPRPGSNASLAVLGNNLALVQASFPGTAQLFDTNTADLFDANRYRLTLPDGRMLDINQATGLEKLTDLNGNTLTVSAAGIIHSSGKSVSFTRDTSGRIAQITDPAGNVITYTYSPTNDLATVKDAVNNVTTFGYDANHGLLTIQDPRGVQPIRNVYDNIGRLIQHIDAFAKTITYTHNIGTRQEIITDRLNNVTVNEYDADGNIVKVTDALGGITTRTYDAHDNTLTETNALGKTRTYTYDLQDNRLTETDPLGQITTYAYNNRKQVLTVTDALGQVTTNTYDVNGNLVTSKDAANNLTTYAYNAQGLRTSMIDALGRTTGYQYDAAGDLTEQTDVLNHVTTYTYDANGNRLSETRTRTGPSGPETLVTSYQYDPLNRLVKTTYPDGAITQIAYNAIGKQSVTIDQLGRQTSYQYDLMGRLTQTSFPDGTSEAATYDAEGDRLTSTDRAGRVTTYLYDALKRLTKTTSPDTTVTTTTYDAIGQVRQVTDPRGNATTYAYDNAGRRTKVTNALNQATNFAYDTVGNQTQVTDANGNQTQYQHDTLNRRTRVIYADGTFDSIAYDALGRTTSKTDQAGKTTQFRYDALGRLTQVTDALNQNTSYSYDEVGNRLSQTDAKIHITAFAYDKLGRRTKRTLPLGMSEISTYDAAGNLKTKTDFNGKTTTYTYDAANRLLSKIPDASFGAPTVTFAYTATGQRQSMADSSGTTTYSYDLRDRLTQKATPQGTLTYTYDVAGNLATIRSSNSGGTSVDYSCDQLNRLSSAKDNRLTSGTTTYTYDAVGNLQGYLYPNGVQSAYQYNTLNRLTSLTINKGAALATYAYQLGAAGNRIQVTELGGRTVAYQYDNLYRLTQETIAGAAVNGTIGYQYDVVGNRLQRTSTVPAVPATSQTYDANDRLTTDSYDQDGNTTASASATYTYDFENHLKSQNAGVVAITYDGDGNRVAAAAAGTTTTYLVDDRNLTGYAQVLEEISGGSVQRVYTYGLNRISQSQALGTSFYGYDGHGSVRLLTDATGAVTDRYDYDAFGNVISQAGTTPNVYLYSGEQNDPNLGLYYLRARYMSRSTGRFWSMDTDEGDPDSPISLHKYTYVGNEPVVRLDPSGNQFDLVSLSLEIASFDVFSSITTVHAGGLFAPTPDAGHGIFLDGHCFPCGGLPWEHAFLKVRPTNWIKWVTKRRLAFSSGSATIGAGGIPSFTIHLLTLTKGINRPTDVNDPILYSAKLNISPDQEDVAITRLFNLFDQYKNDLPYDKFPFSPRPGYYNSNSFISGLLDAAGIAKPSSFPVSTFPDWANPVPPWKF